MGKKSGKKNHTELFDEYCELSPSQLAAEYKKTADDVYNKAWDIFSSEDGWKTESGSNLHTGVVKTKKLDQGKTFKLEGIVNMPMEEFFQEINLKMELHAEWNPTLKEAKRITLIGNDIDVIYHIANGFGPIQCRDFVSIRHWRKQPGLIFSATAGTEHPDHPHSTKMVRAWNNPGGWVLKEIPGEPDKCIFMWLSCVEFRGWIPQKIIDQAMSSFLLDYLHHIRSYVAKLQGTDS